MEESILRQQGADVAGSTAAAAGAAGRDVVADVDADVDARPGGRRRLRRVGAGHMVAGSAARVAVLPSEAAHPPGLLPDVGPHAQGERQLSWEMWG